MKRTVLITGAGNGIGAATAQAFGRLGDDVVVSDIDGDAASAVASRIRVDGGTASAHRLDVATTEGWERLSEELRSAERPPAVIVNNAFRYIPGAAHEIDDEQWGAQLNVTLAGVWRSMRTFHDTLTAASGSMINVSSVHALVAWPRHPAYAAAKGGIVALTRQLSFDYAPAVRVNAVLPGSIATRIWNDVDEEDRRAAVRQATLQRLGRPDEVASVIAFLASEGASYITGAAIPIDGGQTTTVAT